MPNLLVTKPAPEEQAPYFSRYLDRVADGDILGTLAGQLADTLATLRRVSDEDSLRRYAPGKWSVREVLGHVMDTDRIFGYRALRIARGDKTPLPGFEQDDYIPAAQFDRRPWADLLAEFEAVRRSNLLMLSGFDEEAWLRRGTVDGNTVSTRALAYLMAGHELHHMGVLCEKYGIS
jgi:uncharacterized damage-inducible protein DinB